MQGTIERISSTLKGFRIVGQEQGAWFNKGKMLSEDLIPSLKKGDTVEFTSPDGKWVTSLKKLDGSVAAPAPAGLEAAAKVFAPADTGGKKSDAQARGCAANAVLGSPYIHSILAGECNEETVQNVKDFMEKVAEFVYGGKF